MATEGEPEDTIRFHLTFSLDRDRFFRRSCPSCGRDFKTNVSEADLVTSLQPAFRQMGLEIGSASPESLKDIDQVSQYLFCPYCGHRAESADMLTQTFRSYLRRYAMREYILPQLNKMLSGFSDSFRNIGRGSSRGLISMKVSFEHNRALLPPRPICGPEPPDMITIDLLCCGEKVKILDSWHSSLVCPHCGETVLPQ